MFESIMKLVRKVTKKEDQTLKSKDAAKERLHLVLMQDRANVSADFLDLMKQEIIDVIKKYIEIDESAIDVKLTNKDNGDGTNGAPALYANIPILNIKDEVRQTAKVKTKDEEKKENFINDNEEKKETLLEDNQEKEEITIIEENTKTIEEKNENEQNNNSNNYKSNNNFKKKQKNIKIKNKE
jgi:cell division topological specificity factor minE